MSFNNPEENMDYSHITYIYNFKLRTETNNRLLYMLIQSKLLCAANLVALA